MFVVRATKKLRDRLGPVDQEEAPADTVLGDWYATAWLYRPQIALFVSEATLLPVVMPLAPAATLLGRFPHHLARTLRAHDVPDTFVAEELSRMDEARLAKTSSRSMVGIMNEFTFLADARRDGGPLTDLLALAQDLARTPCSPLYKRHVSPDRELRALVAARVGNPSASPCVSGNGRSHGIAEITPDGSA